VAERGIAYMNGSRHAAQPFFLVASFPDPHHPFDPPESMAAHYDPAAVPMPIGGPEDLTGRPPHYMQQFRGEWSRRGLTSPSHPDGYSGTTTREKIAHTCAMVELIDRNVGKLLDYLDRSAMADNTIILFTSDHGELLGDHGLWYKGPFFYEGLLNTPLIAAGPGVPTGTVSDTLFSDLDIAPTLCDLAGMPPMPGMDGVSQKPHLDDPRHRVRDHCLIEYRNGYGAADVSSKCIVTDTTKYVRYQDGAEELTDLRHDPEERTNLAAATNVQANPSIMRERLLDAILATECKYPEQISHA
jgi:arylsulfatase A-like enzyme